MTELELDVDTCKRRLLAVAGVHEVHLLVQDPGPTLVAYVVGGERAALEAALAGRTRAGVVRVDCLPLDASGEVDAQALRDLPVWTAAGLAAAEAQYAPSAGAIVYRPLGRAPRRVHLADLLPEHRLFAPGFDSAAAVPQRAAAQHAAPAARPSLYHAPPLSAPDGLCANLGAALHQAAQVPGLGTVQIGADLSELCIGYAELYHDARRILAGLRRRGIGCGDTVLVDASDSATLLPLLWACVLGGMVAAPFALGAVALGGAHAQRLRDSWQVLGQPLVVAGVAAARALAPLADSALRGLRMVDDASLRENAPASPEALADPARVALIMLTSGSTGAPKGVMLTESNILAMIAGVQELGRFQPGETTFNWMPLDHVGALAFLSILPVALRMHQVHVETATILAAPARWLDLLHAHRASMVWAPNFAFDLILRAAPVGPSVRDLSSLRMLVSGGEAVSGSVVQAFLSRFARDGLAPDAIWPAFGMTETVSAFSFARWRPGVDGVTSLGWPIRGAAQRIVDEAGAVLPEGSVGRVELSGASLFAGYVGRPDLTAAVMRGAWFQSGDLGFMREGALFIVGRSKETIIVNGANFHSAEIEEALARVDGVERLGVAAIGVRAPGALTDQLAVFFHAPEARDDAALKLVMEAIRMRLGQDIGLMPAYFIALAPARLPRTSSGKIQRGALKALTEAGQFDAEIKHAACLTGAVDTLPAWFAQALWKRRALDPAGAPAPATIAVFGAVPATLAALGAAWPQARWLRIDGGADCERAGPRHWRIDAARAGHYPALLRALAAHEMRPDIILVLAGAATLATVLYLCQALAALAEDGPAPSRLVLAAGGDPHCALLGAWLRTAACEIAPLTCQQIDLPGADAALLCRELQSGQAEAEVAYRAGQRHVKRYTAALGMGAPEGGFKRGGVYLMSGGLGGVGRLLARQLLREYGAKLLIVGRTPPGRDTLRGALAELECDGEVLYACADVADGAALARAVGLAHARWQRNVDGVLHLAGQGRETALAQEDLASIGQALRAKVAGTQALYELVAADPEASFIVFGSLAGLFGGKLVGAYAAANAFQAAFIEQLAARGRRHCRYLGFSSWRDTGMSRGGASAALLEAAGYASIDPQAGLASIEVALRQGAPVLAIGVDLRHPRHAFLQEAGAGAVDQALLLRCAGAGQPATEQLRDALGRTVALAALAVDAMPLDAHGAIDRAQLSRIGAGLQAQTAPRDAFERYMAQLWSAILNLDGCGVDDNFFALGGGSLQAAQVALRTRELFRLDVALSDLLAGPTVAQFCARLRACESQPGLSVAIARRLFQIGAMTPAEKETARAVGKAS
ncbi:acyl-CoA synthetase (AMP-forming)/AMP-acid ligase II/NADP-dependent 3-hydroxy acid dehydrogenase YdfG [Oxalobacteraceae bacterium GrIS 1.11]